MIKHLKHNEIDVKKWNNVVEHAFNSCVMAYSWYLDAVLPGWEAFVWNDYECIMPLPVRKKMGFEYLSQPILIQQLNIYSNNPVANDVYEAFLSGLNRYRYYLLYFNSQVPLKEPTRKGTNYVLDLSKTYDEIKSGYSRNVIKNLKKAQKAELRVERISYEIFITFYVNYDKGNAQALLKKVIFHAARAGKTHLFNYYGVYTPTNELVAVNIYLESFDTFINYFSASSPVGKKTSALFLLMDTFIREHAGTNTSLDFEGSNIESIAYFFQGFGPQYVPYNIVEKGKMPLMLRVLRKMKRKLVN